MPSHILTDVANDLWVDSFALRAGACSVTKRTLRGGRRDGVDLVRLDNGAFSVDVVPTRGMGLHRGDGKGTRIGWTSAVTDGPVNPKFVNLMAWGGLGWLEGYDEMLVRCGLENIGSPYQETASSPDGTKRDVLYGLHGKIGNILAGYVRRASRREIRVDDGRGARRRVEAVRAAGPAGDEDQHHARLEQAGCPG